MNQQAEQVKAAALEAIKQAGKEQTTLDKRTVEHVARTWSTLIRAKEIFEESIDNLPAPEPSEFMRWLKDHMDGGDGRTNTEDDYSALHKFGVYKLWKRIKQELEAEGGSDG